MTHHGVKSDSKCAVAFTGCKLVETIVVRLFTLLMNERKTKCMAPIEKGVPQIQYSPQQNPSDGGPWYTICNRMPTVCLWITPTWKLNGPSSWTRHMFGVRKHAYFWNNYYHIIEVYKLYSCLEVEIEKKRSQKLEILDFQWNVFSFT